MEKSSHVIEVAVVEICVQVRLQLTQFTVVDNKAPPVKFFRAKLNFHCVVVPVQSGAGVIIVQRKHMTR